MYVIKDLSKTYDFEIMVIAKNIEEAKDLVSKTYNLNKKELLVEKHNG